jgi:hypothetical protein
MEIFKISDLRQSDNAVAGLNFPLKSNCYDSSPGQNGSNSQKALLSQKARALPIERNTPPVKSIRFLIVLAILPSAAPIAADSPRTVVWQGTVHLGDNPQQFSSTLSAGMLLQVPFQLAPEKRAGKLTITTRDIQTLAGDGHYADLLAHYEDPDGPAREYLVQTFRLKGDSNNVDVDHAFDLEPLKGLYAPPAYYSLRIKIDNQIKFSLWDDFLLKRIEIQQ